MTINFGRVIVGGIAAGVVIDAFEAVGNGMLMAPQWAAIMTSLNRPQIGSPQVLWFNIVGLAAGIAAVWTYAAIRPRFGAGVRTALIAAAQIWLTFKALGVSYSVINGVYPLQPMVTMLAWQVAEIAVATLIGAWLYRED